MTENEIPLVIQNRLLGHLLSAMVSKYGEIELVVEENALPVHITQKSDDTFHICLLSNTIH